MFHRHTGTTLVVLLLLLAPAAYAQTGMLSQRVEAESFFLDDPKWVFGIRAALGYEIQEDLFPDLGLHFGRHCGDHFYIGGYLDARLTAPQHLQADFRYGVRFARQKITLATGTGVGALAVFKSGEIGPYFAWWFDFRYHIRGVHSLLVFAQADLLFEKLGFRRTRQFFKLGVGWEWSF